MALEPGRGRSAVPVHSSLLAIVLGVVAVTGTVTFGASLHRLLTTPRLVGWNWDSRVGYPADPEAPEEEYVPMATERVSAALDANPDVAAYGFATIFAPFPGRTLELGEQRLGVGSFHFDPASGDVEPSIVEGRMALAPDELLLGPVTADELDVGVGDRITAYGQTGEWGQPETYEDTVVEMEVVGLAVLPGASGDRLGTGAATTIEALDDLAGGAEIDSILLRFEPGADPVTVVLEMADDLGLPDVDRETVESELREAEQIPTVDVRQVDELPWLVGVLMAVMTVAVLAHVLVSAVTARRTDLALLRAIGFERRDVRHAVAWQAATIAVASLAIAVPIGIVAGRALWLLFVDRIGAVPEPVLPLTLALVPVMVLISAQLVAAAPAWLASRPRPAAVLRGE
jgi:ABC-type lipoprotein release transport system permease subunit